VRKTKQLTRKARCNDDVFPLRMKINDEMFVGRHLKTENTKLILMADADIINQSVNQYAHLYSAK